MDVVGIVLVGGIAYYLLKNNVFEGLSLDNLFDKFIPSGNDKPDVDGSGTANGKGITFHAVGDIESNKATAVNLASGNPDIILLLGDYAYKGSADSWWSGIMSPIHNQLTIAVLGNHDNDDYLKLFKAQDSWSFAKSIGNVMFVAVNSEKPSLSITEELIKKGQANSNVKWIIPFMHKLIVAPSGSHHGAEVPTEFHTMFKKYNKIKLVLHGHNHVYTRMVPQDGITYVVSGLGGRKPYNGAKDSRTAVAFNKPFGVLKCTTSNSSISCKFIPNGSNSALDSFTIT